MNGRNSKMDAVEKPNLSEEEWLMHAIELYNAQSYKEALQACDNAIQLNSASSRAYHGRGLIFTVLKEYGMAVNCYQQACELAPNNTKLHFDMAEQLYILTDYERAYPHYKKAINLNNKYENAYLASAKVLIDKADILWVRGKYSAVAIEAYMSALKFHPEDEQLRKFMYALEAGNPRSDEFHFFR